jgi:hypothetical protein
MSTITFNQGDTVYTVDGDECEYVAAAHVGHIVLPLYGGGPEDGPYYGDPMTVAEVLADPPKPRLAAEIAEARAQLERLLEQVTEREGQLRELQRGDRERLARLKEHRQLARIDDWMAGKITHFVVWRHYGRRVEVKTWDEAMEAGERRRDHIPLLVLNGTLEWVDNYARMGIDWCITTQGGSNTVRVIPCCSAEEARERAVEAIEKITADRMRERRNSRASGYDHELEDCVESMRSVDMPIPPDVAAAYAESRAAAAEIGLTHARRELAKAQLAMREAEAKATAAGIDVGSGS